MLSPASLPDALPHLSALGGAGPEYDEVVAAGLSPCRCTINTCSTDCILFFLSARLVESDWVVTFTMGCQIRWCVRQRPTDFAVSFTRRPSESVVPFTGRPSARRCLTLEAMWSALSRTISHGY